MRACVRVCLCAVDRGSSKTNSLKHNKQCSVWKLKMKVTDYARDQDLRAVGIFLYVSEAMAGNLRGNRVWLRDLCHAKPEVNSVGMNLVRELIFRMHRLVGRRTRALVGGVESTGVVVVS